TEALEVIGLPAVEALRTAAQSDDPEVRRRAERLVNILEQRHVVELARSIIDSNLTPAEKGRKLAHLWRDEIAEGETATEALGTLLAPVLEALDAAIQSHDPEGQRQTERLVTALEERHVVPLAQSIRDSNLSPEEKGRKLQPLIKRRMKIDQLTR